ncbi:unnamed protein product [Mytilus coruscus]|uniref:Reverse transcriptase zinc-binding domain-containing protein n=1 Tax=Mytilus coruscus TaxID=42192 RepID=A0A6J8DEC3_MYTCO|nr:unnamed protein product [Mytilus coruscus]
MYTYGHKDPDSCKSDGHKDPDCGKCDGHKYHDSGKSDGHKDHDSGKSDRHKDPDNCKSDGHKDPYCGKSSCADVIPEFIYMRIYGNILSIIWILDVQPLNVVTFVDSLSALQAIRGPLSKVNNLIIYDIYHNITTRLKAGINVMLEWFPSHVCICGNELAELRTGYAKLNKHLYKIGCKESETCEHCGRAPETVKHILLECATYNDKRNVIFQDVLIKNNVR